MNKPLAAVILAAGKGTRMGSDLPKVLHEVGGKPMIVHVIHTARNLGAKKIITVIGHKYEMVQKELENESVNCILQLQQLGTAHAVMQCQDFLSDFQDNIIILYGDVPLIKVETLSQLIEVHENEGALSTILTTDLPYPTGYGRIIRNPDRSLMKIVEEKDATYEERAVHEINSGIYIFDAQILFRLLPAVGNNNRQNEYYLPDVLNLIIQEKEKVAIDKINNYIEIQGVNNTAQLTKVNELYTNP